MVARLSLLIYILALVVLGSQQVECIPTRKTHGGHIGKGKKTSGGLPIARPGMVGGQQHLAPTEMEMEMEMDWPVTTRSRSRSRIGTGSGVGGKRNIVRIMDMDLDGPAGLGMVGPLAPTEMDWGTVATTATTTTIHETETIEEDEPTATIPLALEDIWPTETKKTNQENFVRGLPPNPPAHIRTKTKPKREQSKPSPSGNLQSMKRRSKKSDIDTPAIIAAYSSFTGDLVGWLYREAASGYRITSDMAEAENFVLPNTGPSLDNTIRTSSESVPYLGALLGNHSDYHGGIGYTGTNFLILAAVHASDRNRPIDTLDYHGYETSNWSIPEGTFGRAKFRYHNLDDTYGIPRWWYQEEKSYIFGATDPTHISTGNFGPEHEVFLRYELRKPG